MGILEDAQTLKNQGLNDTEVAQDLQGRGYSPKAINDAFNQMQVKQAVSDENSQSEDEYVPSPQQQGDYQPMQRQDESEDYSPQQSQYPEVQQQEYYPQQAGSYGSYQDDYSPGFDTNRVIEISEQVFSEKIQKLKKQINELTEFKTLAQGQLENISERLKKIESVIDSLQIKILDKVGSYGQGLESIKKEMSMMQDSFGKMVNNVADENSRNFPQQKPSMKNSGPKSLPKRISKK